METAKNYNQQQLDLFNSLPNKPYCMDEKPGFMLIRTKSIAVKKPYIQVNPPLMTIYFVFDDDKEDSALSWFDADLPAPLWTTQNPENAHSMAGSLHKETAHTKWTVYIS